MHEFEISDQYLGELITIFPDKDIDELSNTLQNNGNDLELSISMLLSAQEEERYIEKEKAKDPEVLLIESLHDQFQDFTLEEVEQIYKENEKDQSNTLLALLNLNFLKEEEINVAKQSKIEKGLLENGLNEDSLDQEQRKEWADTNSKIEMIRKYTDAPLGILQAAFFNNQTDVSRAVISVISDYEKYQQYYNPIPSAKAGNTENENENDDVLSKSNDKLATKPTKLKNKYGRVQIGNRFQYLKDNVPDSKKDVPDSRTVHEAEKIFKPFSSNIKYTMKNKNVTKLEEIINGNDRMKFINHAFVVKSYEYFNGDIDKCVDMFMYLVSTNAIKYTHALGNKITTSAQIQTNFKLAPRTTLSSLDTNKGQMKFGNISHRNKTSSSINEHMFSSRDIYVKANHYIHSIFTDFRADFHGFKPQEATLVLQIILAKWWAEEEHQREMNNSKHQLSKALHVNPYTVVTGRGIHSIHGRSVVRIAIKKMLDNSKFIYDEEASFFQVLGVKR